MRGPVPRSEAARDFADRLLGRLARERYSPAAWAHFFARSFRRSAEDARRHPRATKQIHLFHVLLLLASRSPWPAVSWLLAWSHLGLLSEHDDGIGIANLLTLTRANLPVLAKRHSGWTAGAAALTDSLDGAFARRRGSVTAFGSFADPLADGVFWTWFAFRNDPSDVIRLLTLSVWVIPPVALAVGYFARAGVIDAPRPEWSRYLSACLQALMIARTAARARRRSGMEV